MASILNENVEGLGILNKTVLMAGRVGMAASTNANDAKDIYTIPRPRVSRIFNIFTIFISTGTHHKGHH